MSYSCTICNYETDNKSNLTKHMKTKKHTEDEIKIYKCDVCNIPFRHNSSLSRHKKTHNLITNKPDVKDIKVVCTSESDAQQLKELKKQYEDLKEKRIKDLEESKSALEKNNTDLQRIINKLCDQGIKKDTTINNSVSALTFLMTYRKKAPPLKEITYEGAKQILGNSETNTLINDILCCYKNKKLAKYIGSIIVKCYKKENPEEQSMWNTDVTRLTYLIKDIIGKKGKSQWIMDKKGVKVVEYIIRPILEYIVEIAREHIKLMRMYIKEATNVSDQMEFTEIMAITADMIAFITSGQMEKEISRYVSAHFQLNKHIH